MPPNRESVSVVIGAYNAGAWIKAAIESSLAQTHAPDEVIVVDDGSSDDTAAVAASFGPSIRVLEEGHRGRPRRNRGIEAARSNWIAFLDADDVWHPRKLEFQFARMGERRAKWAISGAAWQDAATGQSVPIPGMAPREGDILIPLFMHNFIVASTALVPRELPEAMGGFDESDAVAPVEDWDLWLRVAAIHPVACAVEALATVRLHPDSFLASTPMDLKLQSMTNVIDRAAAREPARLGRRRALAMHNAFYAAGVASFRGGQSRAARRYFFRAWRHKPTDLAALAYTGLTYLGRGVAARWPSYDARLHARK